MNEAYGDIATPRSASALDGRARGTVLTFGEAMLRLVSRPGTRLAQAAALDVHVAGSEANVAALLAQLGLDARWASRLPTGPLGRRVERELAGLGVRTDAVQWTEHGRLGLFFAEAGAGSRPATVLYDRARSAFADIDGVADDLADGADFVHLSGITPALGAGPAAATEQLAGLAERAGARLSFDVNFRATLWSAEAARAALTPLAARADVVFCAERDARAVFALDGDEADVLAGLAGLAPRASLVVLTRGADGCMARDAEGVHHGASAAPTAVLDPFGMGDALVAGVLWGLLRDDVPLALRAGVELAALKATLYGDLVQLVPGELAQRLQHHGGAGVRR